MKINEVVNSLCNHEISKSEATDQLISIMNGLRVINALEFTVDGISYTTENCHGFLTLKIPYGYSKIKDKILVGDKVDLIILP